MVWVWESESEWVSELGWGWGSMSELGSESMSGLVWVLGLGLGLESELGSELGSELELDYIRVRSR